MLGEEVDGKGAVAAVAVAHLRLDRPLLLLVHRNSGALVWDVRWACAGDSRRLWQHGPLAELQCMVSDSHMQLARPAAAAPLAAHPSLPRRAERILCMALEYEGEASKPTCACWVGERANCFAVGYDDGSVLLWGVPSQALQGEPWGGRLSGSLPSRAGAAGSSGALKSTACAQRSCMHTLVVVS